MQTPILDQIEAKMDNGIILIVAIIAAITIIALIFKAIINTIVNKKVQQELNNNKAAHRAAKWRKEVVNNFFENSIRYDIENMSVTLPEKANELISIYND